MRPAITFLNIQLSNSRMIEEEWLGSDEDDWLKDEELPFD
mgnify:CR=1 FL=1